jgi:hypothetical protein
MKFFEFFIVPVRANRISHLIFLNLFVVIISGEEEKL